MPRIFDNIQESLLPALTHTLAASHRADFCVGYFNLRGWKQLDRCVEPWSGGDGRCCRLLIGMQKLPEEELREAMRLIRRNETMDQATQKRMQRKLAEAFREQLALGVPTNEDEAGLRRLAAQLHAKKLVVKLFLRHLLHAKLYLCFRDDYNNPVTGFVGSSNLTFAGITGQGELNVDVVEHDAARKLAAWFDDRWNDRWCVDISDELAGIIEESWAREDLIPPYHIYVKMAYHLSQEARAGLAEFDIPRELRGKLLPFQTAAVKIAAHHINKRGGVLIGDVVGLGKTLMATAVAKIYDELGWDTLIICPRNLVRMWNDYVEQYRLHAKVMSLSQVLSELPENTRRYRLVLIDESHNLRNRESKRYRVIRDYIERNESRCILLSATPYNKTYLDLSNQLRLFLPEDKPLGIRPEHVLRELGDTEFIRRYQCGTHTLAAFEKSSYADDWRELMRLYMVRRTRSFILDNYAELDDQEGRRYLQMEGDARSYFPARLPRTARFTINEDDPTDQYSRLYAADVVDVINNLNLPRYGLGNYSRYERGANSRRATRPAANNPAERAPSDAEWRMLDDLSRAGRRLMGFCRTNLFKRLESSGQAFLQSIERHVLRNFIYLYAIEKGELLPIGTQDAGLLDSRYVDEDENSSLMFDNEAIVAEASGIEANEVSSTPDDIEFTASPDTEATFKRRAAEAYALYASEHRSRFKWLRPSLFKPSLAVDLRGDAEALMKVLRMCGEWSPGQDAKLTALIALLKRQHPHDKVLIFTQFADTARYLEQQLQPAIGNVAAATGDSPDPTALAWRFSPISNDKCDAVRPEEELRVLIATDILSEGQNLQDCFVVVNYDLPWAIIRLIQRAGRVDRIGQQSAEIYCYSFLPADGVERIISLRARVRQRLRENAEVVGADEAFFEDDKDDRVVINLYNEKAGILDGEADTEVDLASYAYQIWKNAITADPALERAIPAMPNVVFSTKHSDLTPQPPKGGEPAAWSSHRDVPPKGGDEIPLPSRGGVGGGVLVYVRSADGNDALAWVDGEGNRVTESQYAVLQAAACQPDTPALPRQPQHHELTLKAVEILAKEERSLGGQLGRPSSARFRAYERLKRHAADSKGTLFDSPQLAKVLDAVYRLPLRQSAIDTLNRQLRMGISDEGLAELCIALYEDDRLCVAGDEQTEDEPQIICSMGLAQ